MRTFTFTHLSSPIQDFQFLTDSSGFVLTNTGKLYRFMGQQTTLVETPTIFTITHFHFIDQTHGALVGSAQVVKPSLPAQKKLGGLRWTALAFAAVAGVAGPSARAIHRPPA